MLINQNYKEHCLDSNRFLMKINLNFNMRTGKHNYQVLIEYFVFMTKQI